MAYAQKAAPLSSFTLASSNGCDRESDGRVDTRVGGNSTVRFGNGLVGASYFTGDCASNGHVGYCNLEKGVVSHDLRHPDAVEIIGAGQTVRMEVTLDITIHHARDIQNICIYGNQDVYAKFALTNSEHAIFSTQPVRAGGKNPVFNQSLQIPVSQRDTVLKCEIWMMSCARNYLEDQLLGFVLVPLANLVGKGKLTQYYMLTSTELFHTPAGTVCLSLAFSSRRDQPEASHYDVHNKLCTDGSLVSSSPKSPEVMLVDSGDHILTPTDYNKIEFPDLQTVSENQHMMSVYFNMTSGDLKSDTGSNSEVFVGKKQRPYVDISVEHQGLPEASFLHLGSSPMAELVDCEMTPTTGDKYVGDAEGAQSSSVVGQLFKLPSSSGHPSLSHVEALSSSTSASASAIQNLTEDRNVSDQEQSSHSPPNAIVCSVIPLPSTGTAECVSRSSSITNEKMDKEKGMATATATTSEKDIRASIPTAPVSINLEPEEPIVQQQIVDMYMKSMQQFTESLAKMKLPLDIDTEAQTEPISAKSESKSTETGKKDGHRVFYGSRAFF